GPPGGPPPGAPVGRGGEEGLSGLPVGQKGDFDEGGNVGEDFVEVCGAPFGLHEERVEPVVSVEKLHHLPVAGVSLWGSLWGSL
ncbi:hypothetical protein ENH_00013750, partial [Eimeria necatrix]